MVRPKNPNDPVEVIQAASQEWGVPTWIGVDIADEESGLNPSANVMDTNGAYSTGLFQLNQKGQGKGYSVNQLKNPMLNANIGVRALVGPYKQSVKLGLTGFDQLAYVASHGGHPGNTGVMPDSYKQRLHQVYLQNGGADTATDTGQTNAGTGTGGVSSFFQSLQAGDWQKIAVDAVFALVGVVLIAAVV